MINNGYEHRDGYLHFYFQMPVIPSDNFYSPLSFNIIPLSFPPLYVPTSFTCLPLVTFALIIVF